MSRWALCIYLVIYLQVHSSIQIIILILHGAFSAECRKTKTKVQSVTVTANEININSTTNQGKARANVRGTQQIVSVEYLFGRPVIASNFRLGKCHLELS